MTGVTPVATLTLHANALVVGEAGILLRGASGTGKTTLALALIAEARRDARFARLVADDRSRLDVAGGRLIARPHPRITGLVERRGFGIVGIAWESACVIRLVVDLLDPSAPAFAEPPRLPETPLQSRDILGVSLAALTLVGQRSSPDICRLVIDIISFLETESATAARLPDRLISF